MLLRTEATYHCDPEFYLEQYFEEKRRTEREVKGVGNISFSVLESHCEGEVWSHVAESVSRLDAPMPVRKILGETTRMEEHATWRRSTNTIDVEYKPDNLRKRISVKGHIRVGPAGEGKCHIVVEMDVIFKIFAVGGMLEKLSAKEMPIAIEKDCAYFNEHLAPK
jgi:Protein of unknown function (DUF2505)